MLPCNSEYVTKLLPCNSEYVQKCYLPPKKILPTLTKLLPCNSEYVTKMLLTLAHVDKNATYPKKNTTSNVTL